MLIHPAEARRLFREYTREEITNANLAYGALLVGLEDNPGMDLQEAMAKLDGLATRIRHRVGPDDPPAFRLGHVHAVLFDDEGFRGDIVDYYDPRNAYLHQVLERKLGLPITLSILFLHVATAVGLSASGVGLPGHYVVKVQFELNELYIDPFHEGSTLTTPGLAALLNEMSGGSIRLTSEHLRAWSGRETLARVLTNLQLMWTRAGDPRKANAARERLEMLAA